MYYALNKAKAQPATSSILKDIYRLAWQFNIQLRAAYIPSKLNTAADILSRLYLSAKGTDFAIKPSLFKAVGGLRCNTIAFADIKGKTARLLLAPTRGQPAA